MLKRRGERNLNEGAAMEFYSEFAENVFRSMYLQEGEKEPEEAVRRIDVALSKYDSSLEGHIFYHVNNQILLPSGGIWRAAGNPHQHVSYVNCTTLYEVEDNLESIFESLYWLAKFAAYGQGDGVDISKLRPKGVLLRNTARTSTGGVSLMKVYDVVLRWIAQHGRRGASLISIHDTYPDIEEFCMVKQEEGEVETANISIQTTDAFMQAVEDDKEWELTWQGEREDLSIKKIVRARGLFDMICEAAWKTGDPGLLFIDTTRRESNSDVLGFPVVCTNACSEVPSDPHNTCILSSINLVKLFELYPTTFEHKLESLVGFAIRMLDAVVEAEYQEERSPSPQQREKLRSATRIGLGVTGFADYLIERGVPYGSPSSFSYASQIARIMARAAYQESAVLGKERGSFTGYDKKKYMQSHYIRRLLDEGVITEADLKYQRHMCKLSIAPTGTLSIIANCGGSGVEPIYSKYMVRRERATTGEWKEWFVYNQAVERQLKKQGKELSKKNADALNDNYWVTAHTVNPFAKIQLLREWQKYIDQGISVTYNLPTEATVEDVKKIYEASWRGGLKGATVYLEGCRGEGVLITEDNYNKTKRYKKRLIAPRPKVLAGKVFRENNYTIVIGFKDGKPYEIFGGDVKNKLDDGDIMKVGGGQYELNDVNILDVFKDQTICAITRLSSLSLRHAVPLQFVVEQLKKQSTITHITAFFARQLAKYLVNEEVLSNNHCTNCGGDQLRYESGCVVCTECGLSACS